MYIVLGILAIVFTFLGLIWSFRRKPAKWFRFLGLSLTALTMCGFYSDAAIFTLKKDWSGLIDVVPTIHKTLWILVVISIILNGISLIKENK